MVQIAPRIVVDERVRFGKPVIEGTRVPVDVVLGKLAGGMTTEAVADEYGLTREDVLATLAYAAHTVAAEEVRAVSSMQEPRTSDHEGLRPPPCRSADTES